MFENTTENSICGDVPDRNHKSSLKQSNLIGASQINSGFNAGFNASGALEQLSDLLSLHAKGGSMNGFKGTTPTIPVNDLRGDEAIRYSRDQRLIRCQLASLCRLIDLNGWTNSIYNQISAKSGEDEFLVNPFGLLYHEVQASTLVKINSQGNVLDPGSTVLGVNKASWNLHSAVHSTRSDVNCVVNVNLPDVVAVSCIKSGLLPVSPEAVELLPNVRYHDYAGMVTDKAEADAIRNDLGNAKILFLRNKGVTVAASTIPEAWYLMKRVISACQTQMRLLQLGCSANLLSELVFPTGGEKVETGERLSENNGDDYQLQQNSVPFASEANGTACDDNNDCDDHLNGVGAKSTSSGVTDLSGWGVGEMEFEAQMRMLDSAGYRTGYIYRNPSLLRRPPAEVPWSTNGQLAGADSSLYAGTGFLSDCTAGPDASDIDDITAATQAGAKQISEIASTVRSNKEKGVQRNQWLAKPGIGMFFFTFFLSQPLVFDFAIILPLISQFACFAFYLCCAAVVLSQCTVEEQPSFATHLSSQAQSTPMVHNVGNHRRAFHRPSLAEESVEELSTAAAVPPVEITPSSTLDKSSKKSSKKKSGRKSKKTASPFSTLSRSKQYPETVIEEPRTPPTTPRSDLASKSASLPANARNLVNFSERSYNTMVAVDGAASDDEEHKAKVDKKKGGKWGSFRFPTFRKKTKPVAV
ncbi:unnamed protein product [Rodentolepis nana]|uniref:Aldolase_II domain-containing protein n=1 Tax=Rodentolepis nana TaxID=102285 RepID=A0A158QH82_RODNA|nr:unnamed protein product [Rodentolepis nana]